MAKGVRTACPLIRNINEAVCRTAVCTSLICAPMSLVCRICYSRCASTLPVYLVASIISQAPTLTRPEHAIRTEPNWKKYVLPLKDFMLVVRGFEGERSGDLVPERITNIGFLMAEVRSRSAQMRASKWWVPHMCTEQRRNGPFRLEVEYIKAINREVRDPVVRHGDALSLSGR